MFHSWLLETNSDFTPTPVTHNENFPMTHMRTGTMAVLDNRNSEPLGFQTPDGSVMNDIFRPMDWNLDLPLFVTPELSATDKNVAGPVDVVEITETERQSSICWLERSPPANSQSINGNQSNRRKVVAITAEDGDILSELSDGMRQSSKFVPASFQALKNAPDQIPNIFERKRTSNVSEMMKDNFMWSRIVSYATDFDKTILPPFVHRRCLMTDDTEQDVDYANLPEALANCKNIVPIIDLYVIMLAADKEPCNLMGIITGIAMGEIANTIQQQHIQNQGYFCVAEKRGNFPRWSDWILHESKEGT
ncbi:hypothetical protein BDZ45DRAFT_684352 [Acephala macrosclerotiorum]|nr:hypothetical protein BDZ45DRAFT_684352 [Acephala macrosclerotiorum]